MDKQKTDHHAVIPALPGYYLLDPVHGDESIEYLAKIPIVAWVVTYEYNKKEEDIKFPHAQPVTYEGASHGDINKRMVILNPNGEVDAPFDRTWSCVDEYLKSVRAEYERKQKSKGLD